MMKWITPILLIGFMLVAAQPTSAGPLEDGQAAMEDGNYVEAIRLWKPLAEQGNAEAQYVLGGMYDEGQGVPHDNVEAMKWYRKAGAQGHARAQFSLGIIYGHGVGVPQNFVEAAKWYHEAADQGHIKAQHYLGEYYDFGLGVPQNYVEAVKYYRRASDQGDPFSQHSLAKMYALGKGVPQDYVEAYKWANLAASRCHFYVKIFFEFRDTLTSQMTPAQIAEAQRLAREWRPTGEGKATCN